MQSITFELALAVTANNNQPVCPYLSIELLINFVYC